MKKKVIKLNLYYKGIEYSEHSSYCELEGFVRFLIPKEVISTVPISYKNQFITPTIPTNWLGCCDKSQINHFTTTILENEDTLTRDTVNGTINIKDNENAIIDNMHLDVVINESDSASTVIWEDDCI